MLIVNAADPARAAELLRPATTADIQSLSAKGPDLDRFTARSRLVRVDRSALARHVAPVGIDTAPQRLQRARALDGMITIELFPGTAATFRRTEIAAVGDSGYSWSGQAEDGATGAASLIVDAGQVTGHIQIWRRTFRIVPIAGAVHRVIELDPSRFPPD
jgi:hypothetical protein